MSNMALPTRVRPDARTPERTPRAFALSVTLLAGWLAVGCLDVPEVQFVSDISGDGSAGSEVSDAAPAIDSGPVPSVCPRSPPPGASCCGAIACAGNCTAANCDLCAQCGSNQLCCAHQQNVSCHALSFHCP